MYMTTAILIALVVLAAFVYFYRGKIIVSLLGLEFKVKRDKHDPPPTPKAGASIQDAQARGNIQADDRTGRGAEVKGAKAGGDIIVTRPPLGSLPKKVGPDHGAVSRGLAQLNDVHAGRDLIVNLGELAARSAAYVRGPLHQLPSLTEHFTGRAAELAALCSGIRQRATEGKPTAIVSTIEGMGGVGKTELAVAAAYALAGDFPNAQFILRLAAHSPCPATSSQVRDDLLRKIHPDMRLPEDDSALWELYQNIFRDRNGPSRVLLILDDVSGDDQVRALMPQPGCAVIVTSRRALETGEPLRLNAFPHAEAIALLRQFCETLTDADAGAVADLCGDLPVALSAAGGFLKRHASKPPAEYIAELRGDRLTRLHHDDSAFDVNVVFERSLRDMTPPQRAAFHRLAVMAYGFDREAALAVAGCNGDDLDELVALNLLEFHPRTERLNWHNLVREFAAKGLTPKVEHTARMSHAQHFTTVAARANELYLAGGEKVLQGLALFDLERRHIEAAFEFLQTICSGDFRSPSENSAIQPAVPDRRYSKEAVAAACRQLMALVNAVVYTGGLRFHPRHQRIPWLEAQLGAAREIGDRRGEGNALGNLGLAYAALGDARKAIKFYEQRLVIAREIGDRRGEGNAMGNMGNAYAALGEASKAIEFHEQRLVIAREIGDRRGEGNAMGNLGSAYAALGDAPKAIKFYEQRLVIAREIGDRRGEGNAMGNLGNTYMNLGDARKAIECHEQALVIDREIGDRRGEGQDLGNLGNAYAALGDARKATEFYEQQLVIAREIGDRLGEGNALGNLGNAYYSLGDARKATEFYEQQLVIVRETGDRRGEGNALGNLGNAYYSLGDARKATELYSQQLAIVSETGDRRGQGTALWNSALILEENGQRNEAIGRADAALNILEHIEDPNAAKVRATLAEWKGKEK